MNTLKKALAIYGEANQLDAVVEECAELIVAIRHYRRNRCDILTVIEEGVDVQLMLEQLQLISQHSTDWKRIRKFKLRRLQAKLSGGA